MNLKTEIAILEKSILIALCENVLNNAAWTPGMPVSRQELALELSKEIDSLIRCELITVHNIDTTVCMDAPKNKLLTEMEETCESH